MYVKGTLLKKITLILYLEVQWPISYNALRLLSHGDYKIAYISTTLVRVLIYS